MYRVLQIFLKLKSLRTFRGSYTKIIAMFLVLLWYSSSGFLFFELAKKPDLRWSDAIWWTLVTMTTVGYGDFFPESTGGRFLVALPTMVFGIGLLGFLISEIATGLMASRSRGLRGMKKVKDKNHILLINYSNEQKMTQILLEIRSDKSTAKKAICLVDETLEQLPPEMEQFDVRFVRGDPGNEDVLDRAGIRDATDAIILSKDINNPRSDDLNLTITLVIEKMNEKIYTIVEVVNPKKIRQIQLSGANSVICTSELASNLITQELKDHGLPEIFSQISSNRFGKQLYFVPIAGVTSQVYRDLVLTGLASDFSVLGIRRNRENVLSCPSSMPLQQGDLCIALGQERPKSIQY